MKRSKLCCIGYITKDKIVTPTSTVNIPGGTAWYFAKGLLPFSPDGFQLVTAVEDAQISVVEELRLAGIEVLTAPTRQSVCFENIYGSDTNQRSQRVSALPDPFTIDSLQMVDSDVIHLGTLLHDDFSVDVIKYLAGKSRLCADVQGFLRKVMPNGEVIHTDWEEKQEVLPYIYTLKTNEIEAEALTGINDPFEAALKMADWGVKEVIITLGDQGSLIYTKGQFHEIPAYPTLNIVDVTGCGDTYMAGYLYQRQLGANVEVSGKFAAAMCTIKLQAHGPFCGTEKVVRRIINY